MSVRFRLSRLEVRDFRGIEQLDLDLPSGEPSVIVGANNSGKTTVLSALALGLRDGGFGRFAPEPFDFRVRSDGTHATEFGITVRFEPDGGTLPAVQGMGNPVWVHGVRVRGKQKKGGIFEHRHLLIDDEDQPITFSQATPLKGAIKEEFAGTGTGWRPINAKLEDIRDTVPEVWFLQPHNIEAHLYVWRSGPLRRLAQMLSDRFLQEPWVFEIDGKQRSMPQGIRQAHRFFHEAVQRFPFWQDDLKLRLEDALGRYIGGSAKFSLDPSISTIEEWLAQQLTVAFAVEQGAQPTPLQRMGDGWQCLVRLAALDVLSQYDDLVRNDRVVLLMEEPETHLHPHLRRRLRATLEAAAAKGWQVVITTHTPEFVSFSHKQQLTRLHRNGGTLSAFTVSPASIGGEVKAQERLERGRATLEVPFARRVLISEGKSDDLGFRLGLAAFGFDADAEGLSIIAGGGAPGMPPMARLVGALGIPWVAVTDDDPGNPKTERVRADLEVAKSAADLTLVLKGALEGSLGLDKHADSAEVLARLAGASSTELTTEYPTFAELCRAIIDWSRRK